MKTAFNTIVVTLVAFLTGQNSMALPNGNVLVQVSNNGKLSVVGADDDDVFIYVAATTISGKFIIADPAGDTTFNGAPAITVNGAIGDMVFDLGRGRNTLILDDGLSTSVFAVGGNLKITSPSQLQSIIMIDNAVIQGQTTITTKEGRDVVWFVETLVEKLKVSTGDGDDVFYSNGASADFNSTIQLKTGNGNDAVLFAGTTEIRGTLKLQLGNGDDLVGFYNTLVQAPTVLDGKGGIDSYGTGLSVFNVAPQLKSIEFANADINDVFEDAYQNNAIFQQANGLYAAFALGQ